MFRSYVKHIKSLIKNISQPLHMYGKNLFQQSDDHGTAHISAIDRRNDIAVSCTTTINRVYELFSLINKVKGCYEKNQFIPQLVPNIYSLDL